MQFEKQKQITLRKQGEHKPLEMLITEISQSQIERAKEALTHGALRNSITKGKSNLYGYLGEIITLDYFRERGKEAQHKNTYDYDLIVNRRRIDVKSKRTTVVPLDHYNCSVAAFNTIQNCDYYFFTRISEDYRTGYLLGLISKEDFYNQSQFHRQGEIDPSSTFMWRFKADCYNLPIGDLPKFSVETESFKLIT